MRKLILICAVLASASLAGCVYRPYPYYGDRYGDRYYGGGSYGDRYYGGYRNDGYSRDYRYRNRDSGRDYRYGRGDYDRDDDR